MEIKQITLSATDELRQIFEKLEEDQVKTLIENITQADKIFVSGAGRSLLMLRGFAMRLMHLGFRSYVVGDTITPVFSENDLLIIGSGSGKTRTLISIAIKTKEIGGKITLISTREKSTLSKLSYDTIIIPAYTDKVDEPSQRKPLHRRRLIDLCGFLRTRGRWRFQCAKDVEE